MKAEFSQLQRQVRQMLEAGAPRQAVVDTIAKSGWGVQEFVKLNSQSAATPAPAQPPVPAAAPRLPLAFGPAAGRVPMTQSATKTQTEDLNKALKAKNTLAIATNRIREILKENGGSVPLTGELAKKMGIATNQVVTALGAQSEAGTMQPSDIERFTKMAGGASGIMARIGDDTGISPVMAGFDEMDLLAAKGLASRAKEGGAPEFRTDEEAEAGVAKLPPGSGFIGPDGMFYRKKGQ